MSKRKTWILATGVFVVVTTVLLFWPEGQQSVQTDAAPTSVLIDQDSAAEATLQDVLEMAAQAKESLVANVDDYTATFVKQERDANGVLSPVSKMFMKVQTRHRGGRPGAPMRVYLKFLEPGSDSGRQVIWAEDLTNGKLWVKETGMLGLVPIPPLDPNGALAMQGQRYPISELGQTRMVELLHERGQADLGDPNVSVVIQEDVPFDDQTATLIQVNRSKPSGRVDDFSLAEIFIDQQRSLILKYQSFGWPSEGQDDAPLLESYTFEDIQVNVGLSEKDFDTSNPEYGW
ncbi:DUF1571 domain-containing protein [Crateriforma conspicua]|uniref:DUF1571 domain-containing protein n=1 Tax=Crateriforma conspicua TaxID=2527996 RepID=A0A5C6FLU3_9PLAN|nr:DUF1571 domain-containing protein [Crateriforma conspicua]TWU62439.1 hypothetical protein V7x_41740 [Crateriforma conspicua]